MYPTGLAPFIRLTTEGTEGGKPELLPRAMERLQHARDQLSERIVGECASQLGRLAAYASATQEDLDDQLERTEYALIDDEDAVSTARDRTAQARASWLRATGRTR